MQREVIQTQGKSPRSEWWDEEWEQIKIALVDAAREVIQTQGKSPRNERWDEE
jgi:hypothetical protein